MLIDWSFVSFDRGRRSATGEPERYRYSRFLHASMPLRSWMDMPCAETRITDASLSSARGSPGFMPGRNFRTALSRFGSLKEVTAEGPFAAAATPARIINRPRAGFIGSSLQRRSARTHFYTGGGGDGEPNS